MKVLCICSSSTVSASLPDFIIFFIIYHIHKLESAQFRVMGPGHPVTAIVGENIVLPCHLSPRMSAKNMEVRWFRSEFTSVVHQYHEGKDQYGEQMPDYHERTELLKAGITDGNVSLQILNISCSDEGQYSCFVQDGSFYEEALLELKVADSFFPRVNPWMVALSVILVVLFVSIGLTVYLFKIKDALQRELGKCFYFSNEALSMLLKLSLDPSPSLIHHPSGFITPGSVTLLPGGVGSSKGWVYYRGSSEQSKTETTSASTQ
ncbi:butyrophilin subfamily 1 member A1-like isoform X2 [Mauremys reevesii]|uniref:butyrophilin subfamily 1 member A1-like isoform X2 n=1 Tax=Mauremys reevesii TaxID=260615 RepID=UPI00193FF575|nr:butyrophilin subfamily 1 member A1-like isoform X2 [Mauremys reevesii]